MSALKKFTFYWDNGKREVVESNSVTEALTKAGYSSDATHRLSFYTPDENDDFSFDEETNTWKLFSKTFRQRVRSN